MSRFGKGALLMILSALGFSAMQIAIAKTAQGIPLFEQLFFRNLFACIAAFVSLRRKNLAAFGKRENRGLLVFRSAAGYAGMIALFYASGHAAQGDVAIINKMSPFVVTVLACLFLKEKFTAYQGVALGLAFGGALLVSNPTFQSHWFPVAVAFLSAVFSGVAYTAIGALKNREPPEVIVFFFSLFSTIASGIAMLPQFKVPDLSLMLYSATGMNAFLAFFISIILTGGVGYLLDRLALRRLRNKKAPKLTGLITTLGMSMIIDNTIMLAFGSETKPFPNHFDFGRIEIGSVVISWVQIIILATALTLMLILSFVVYKTKIGKAMRCTSQNAEAARLMGISVNRVIAFTFIISGVLACISGNLVGMYYQTVDITMGASIGMKTFASAILGGVGVLPGAMVGGLVVGVIETFSAGYISSGYRDAISFVVLILVLLIKPSGLFGSKQINKV